MPALLDISYYNTFLLKQVTEPGSNPNEDQTPVWPLGFPYNELVPIENIDPFPGDARSANDFNSFYVEESRIRGGYNNTNVDYGVKAFLFEENPKQQHRSNLSGILTLEQVLIILINFQLVNLLPRALIQQRVLFKNYTLKILT